MGSGISDSHWPPRRPAVGAAAGPDAGPAAALTSYPTYLAPPRQEAQRSFPPLLSALAALAVSFVAQLLVAVPLGYFVVARGLSVLSGPHTDEDVQHAAFSAAMTVLAVTSVAGVLAAWGVLRLLGVHGAFAVALAGAVADVCGSLLGQQLSTEAGWLLGAAVAVGVMHALVRRRREPR